MNAIPLIDSIAPLYGEADVWFLDIWGVLHNGVRPFAGAVSACQNFRALGGVTSGLPPGIALAHERYTTH